MQRDITILNEFEGAALLKKAGIPVVENILIHHASETEKAAEVLDFPLVLKICSASVPHKTDEGGVVLNIPDIRTLTKAVRDLERRFSAIPHAFLIQKMAPPGTELIVGARRDPVFGPVVLVGIGGIFTEIFHDSAVELAPVGEKAASGMLSRLKGAALLSGYRTGMPMDAGAVCKTISALSKLIIARKDIAEIDINPLIVYPEGAQAVDALVRLESGLGQVSGKHADPATVKPFFQPSSLAIVGASRSPGKGGNIILRNLQRAGFQGAIYPINPTCKEILGLPTYARLRDVPEPVELAMFVIPKTAVPDAIADCAARGVTNIILSTGGYSDMGQEGAKEQKGIIDQARKAGIRVMGPNSIGTINPAAGMATSIVGLDPILPGGVSLIGQSGVFSSGWARWIADTKPFGVAKVACIGNKGDINESDLLEYLIADDQTRTVGMYLEGIIEGKRFVRIASAACKRKPVVVMKAGRSEAGAAAVASHTGSLAGSDAVFDAVCRRSGLIRVHNSEAFFDTLSAFEKLPLPRGNRLGVLSITGMGCVAATDAAEESDVVLPPLQPETLQRLRELMPPWAPVRNPIDTWSAIEQHGSKKASEHIARCLMEQNDVDALLITFVLMPESMFDIAEAFGDLLGRYPQKPVLASYYGGTAREINHIHEGFAKLSVPCYPTPERAIFAFSRLVDYARHRRVIQNKPPRTPKRVSSRKKHR